MDIHSCPFCNSNKVKLVSNSVFAYGQWLNGQEAAGDRYRYSVRCNSCKARGPIVSCWVPIAIRAPGACAVEKSVAEIYEKKKRAAEQQAVDLWNQASDHATNTEH